MKVTLNIYSDSHGGNHWADTEADCLLGNLPRVGDMVSIEAFFPEFLSADWELGDSIEPYGEVTSVIFYKESIDIDLKA